tara:strand:- start:274 stop:1119 length:846 start_codon:yes stop_codon:yes gene_type:complete
MKTKDKQTEASLVECIAALDYRNNNNEAGKLKLISKHRYEPYARPAIAFMEQWCQYALANETWKDSRFWFDARVMIMDVYTIMHVFETIMKPSDEMCIFYGGSSHGNTLNKTLIQNGATETEPPSFIKDLTQNSNIISLRSFEKNRHSIVVIGEHHSKTVTKFGADLVNLLKSKCNLNLKIKFLIEKHISNKRDPIQTQLTCNMPSMAIHRFRCDKFLETHSCKNLEIISVDNRHYDLGFIRMEIFDTWHKSEQFKKSAIRFQQKVLQHLLRFAKKSRESI